MLIFRGLRFKPDAEIEPFGFFEMASSLFIAIHHICELYSLTLMSSIIRHDTFNGRDDFIHIIRKNFGKPYLLRVNYHIGALGEKPHTS